MSTFKQLTVNDVYVKEGFNPRTTFEVTRMKELTESIKQNGVKLPVTVVKDSAGKLQVVDGERRVRACQALALTGVVVKFPAIVNARMSETDVLVTAVVANEGVPLTALELAGVYGRLKNYGWKLKNIAEKVGKSIAHVQQTMSLLQATPAVQEAVEKKDITMSDAVKIIQENGTDGKLQDVALTAKKVAKTLPKTPKVQAEKTAPVVAASLAPPVVPLMGTLDSKNLERFNKLLRSNGYCEGTEGVTPQERIRIGIARLREELNTDSGLEIAYLFGLLGYKLTA